MHQAFVDVHHHLLCGLDDGPQKIDAMKAMIDAAYADGVGLIIATPHVAPGAAPFNRDAYIEALAQANAFCTEQNYALRILGGAEILYTPATVRLLENHQAPTLAGTRYVLVEWPDSTPLSSVTDAVRNLANAGYIPVLAHVERLRCFHGQTDALHRLKDSFDLRVQVNADSIPDRRPLFSRNIALHLLQSGLVDYVASDAHDVQVRRIRMQAAYDRLCLHCGADFADAVMRIRPMEIIDAIDNDARKPYLF